MDRVANSTPIVDLESRLNSFRVNRLNRLDLPTPESPIKTTIKGELEAWYVRQEDRRTLEEKLHGKNCISSYYSICLEVHLHRIRRSPLRKDKATFLVGGELGISCRQRD